MKKPFVSFLILLLAVSGARAAQSAWVHYDSTHTLVYSNDNMGNHIPDFSFAGYEGGGVAIPTNAPVKQTLNPVGGDNTASIQNAINAVSALTPDTNGFRGVVLLNPGTYQIAGALTISSGGVILRGSGNNTNTGTVLLVTGNARNVLNVSGSGSWSQVGGTYSITDGYVPLGATNFHVSSSSPIIWGTNVTVAADTDVFTNGTFLYAYNWSGTNQTVNGITFTGTSNASPGNVSITGIGSNYHGYTSSSAPFSSLSAAYQGVLTGGEYSSSSSTATLTLNNLTAGHIYAVQMWVSDPRGGGTAGRTATVMGSNEVVLAYNVPAATGGVGQYSIGVFTAGGSSQPFSFFSASSTQINALLVSDVTATGYQPVNPPTNQPPSAFSVGESIVVQRPWTQPWINAIGMNLLTQPWTPGTGMQMERTVTAVNGNQITIDDPLVNPIESAWVTGLVYQVTDTGRIQQCGVENLCAIAQFADYPSNILTGIFANFTNLKNSWMRNLLLMGWGNGLGFEGGSKWCTAQDCIYTNPGTGTASAAPAAWTISGGQCLFQRCVSDGGYYHIMVVQNQTPGPNVFLNFNCTGTHYNGGPHQRWAAGALHDCIIMAADSQGGYTPYLAINNRGNDGSGQGWAAGFSIMYNCQVPQFQLEQPATTTNQYNWTIGGIGSAYNYSDKGIYDGFGSILNPHSLYLEQLRERLGGSAIENIGYQLFTISNSPSSQTIPAGANAAFAVTVGDPALMSNVVALSVSGLPANASAGFSTNSVTGAGSATLTVITSNSIAPGTYTLNVIGANAGLTHTSAVSVVVANLGFSMTASPASQTVTAGYQTNFTVAVVTNAGFTGSVVFSLSGLPPNASAGFNPASVGSSASSTLSVTTTTNTPPGNYPLTISGNGTSLTNTAVVTLVVNGGVAGAPGTFIWNGPGAGNNDWSAIGDWLPVALPGISNDVKFFDAGAAGAVSNINNVVDANFTVSTLQYGNTNGNHTTLVSPGQTLTVGGLTVGTETDNGSAQSVFTTITGTGGALNVTNTSSNLVVRQASANGGSALKATLDLSGLDNFKATVNQVQIGSFGANARPSGTLYLARTNLIVASGSSPAMVIGGQGGGSGNGGNGSFLYLGQTSLIFVNGISVATVKQPNCSMLFNPAFIGSNPAAVFRASDGVSRVPSWLVADSQSGGGTVNTAGTNDFTGGTVDALVDVMTVGRSSSGSGIGNPSGTLTFSAGTVDVNTLQIGYQSSGGPLTNIATGTVNVNGAATLVVNTSIELGHVSAGGTNATKGTLNINGGTVQATNIFNGGGASSAINLNSGILDLQADNPVPGKIMNVPTLNVGANGVAGTAILENAAGISASNIITIASNGIVAGNTSITAPGLVVNGVLSPGVNGVGAMTNSGTATFGAGGTFAVAVQDANGAAGAGWDFLQTGIIDVQATNANPFRIQLQSLAGNLPASVTNFNCDTNYDWVIATATGGITNSAANKFTVDNSLFQNDLAGGYFYARTNGGSLILSFTNNHPPVAGTATIYRTGSTMAIPVANLAGNWSDPDGDPVVLLNVSPSSTNGVNNVGTDGVYVYYTNANNSADAILYTVEDVRTNPPAIYQPGDTQRTAEGQIVLVPPPAIRSVTMSGTGLALGGTGGIVGSTFYVLASTNVALPLTNWTVISTNSFDGGGNFNFTNTAALGGAQSFYLLKLQ